jgi:SAM-dependent methyltransferase
MNRPGSARNAAVGAPPADGAAAGAIGEPAPGGSWRLVSGPHRDHHPSLRQYVVSESLASNYDRHFRDNLLFGYDLRFLGEVLPARGRLLDLGCGTGRHLEHFARAGWRAVGVDLSEPMLREAAAKLSAAGLRAELYRADILDLSFLPAGCFHAAICMFSTLGMIREPELRQRAVCEAARRLAPGGVFAAHVHNRLHFLRWIEGRRDLFDAFVRRLGGGQPVGDCVMRGYRGEIDLYLHNFTLGELLALVRRAGLKVIRTVPLNERRDAEARGLFNRIMANGFMVAARKGRQDVAERPAR